MLTSPPFSKEPLLFRLPSIDHRMLNDGTPVHVVYAPNQDLVTLTIAMRTGSRSDVIQGETSFTAQMLTRGAGDMDSEAFANEVERRGCTIRSAADSDACSVQGAGLAEWFEDLVNLAATCLQSPLFDETDIDKLRQRKIADMLVDLADVEWLASRACSLRAFDGHPYSRSRSGTPTSLRLLTSETLRETHQRMLEAPRHIIIAGPIDADTALSLLNTALGGLPPTSIVDSAPRSTVRARAGVIAPYNEAVQSAVRVALPSVGFDHPDFAALQLVTNILGGYTLARLFTVLREEKGYTYGAYAFSDVRPCGAITTIATSVGNEYTSDTMQVIADQVSLLGSERIGDDELENSRQQILGTFARTNETPQQSASLIWTMILHNLPWNYFDLHVAKLQKLVPEDLLLMQERYFTTNKWSIGISGRQDVVEPAIAPHVDSTELWLAEGYE